MGADVYLNNIYVGVAPVTINNLSEGKYNVSFIMNGYSRYNGTVTAVGGKSTTFSGSLSEAQPKIDIAVTNSSSQKVASTCIFTYAGTVTNTGDATARFLNVSLEFNPQATGYSKKITYVYIDTLQAGGVAGFNWYMAVPCEGNYKAEIRYNGIYVKGTDQVRIDKTISGSLSL